MENPYLLTGFSDLVNIDTVDKTLDIKSIEEKMTGEREMTGAPISQNTIEERYKAQLGKYARELGLKSEEADEDEGGAENANDAQLSGDEFDDLVDEDADESEPSAQEFGERRVASSMTFGGDREMADKTQEQVRRGHITDVIKEISGNTQIYSFEGERREDMKFAMLSEIDTLLASLQEDGVDVSRVDKATKDSPFETIEAIFKILRHKSDQRRFCNMAEEMLLLGVYSLEEVFDGQNVYFGKYRPDLRGWHNEVNVKLRRMRHDTATLVGNILQEMNVGPAFRMLLELVPSLFRFSKMRKEQYSRGGGFEDFASSEKLRDL